MSEQKSDQGTSTKSLIVPIGVGVLSLAAIISGVGVFAAAQASGAQNSKVAICHRTSSQNNPYTTNEIDTDSIDNPADNPSSTDSPSPSQSSSSSASASAPDTASATPSETKTNNGGGNGGGNNTKQPKASTTNPNYLNGHGDHTGPIFVPGASEWGDIIPPFTSAKGNSFPGYNWLNGGQAILERGCNWASPSPSPSDTNSGSATPTDTSSSGSATPTETTPTPTTSTSESTGGGGGGGGTTATPGEATPAATAPGAATVAPGTVVLPTEMPNPVNVAPGAVNIAPGKVSSVPAGNGELVLSLAGMTLIGGGIAGVAGTSVWIADRRRRRTA